MAQTTFVLRSPFPFGHEVLFPAGWRSYQSDYYLLNTFEVEATVIGSNKINGEVTNPVVSVNDLNSEIIVTMVAKNDLEVTAELVGFNHINGELTRDVIGANDLDPGTFATVISNHFIDLTAEVVGVNNIGGEVTREYIAKLIISKELEPTIICMNDILSFDPVTRVVSGVNFMVAPVTMNSYDYTINIYIDGAEVTNEVVGWEINISEDNYVNTATVNFGSTEWFSQCDPTTNIGTKRIRIKLVGSVGALSWTHNYYFLLEKRAPSKNPSDISFSIWGRSFLATLDMPYSAPITHKEVEQDADGNWVCPSDDSYDPEDWQTQDMMASEIIDQLITGVTVSFDITDFVVKEGTFLANGETPIELVNRLIKVVGGIVRTDIDDTLIIRNSRFNVTGTAVTEFSDADEILVLDEELEFPEGHNRVLVRGYTDTDTEQTAALQIELDDVLNVDAQGNTVTRFGFGDTIWIRVYKMPFSITYDIDTTLGSLTTSSTDDSEEVENEVTGFTGETMAVSKPIVSIDSIRLYDCTTASISDYTFKEGSKTIEALDSNLNEVPCLVSYRTKSDLYKLIVTRPCANLPADDIISKVYVEQT